jgi:hypothetical protein
MLSKYGTLGAAWVASDVFTLLQLGWLKAKLPGVYEWTMEIVTPVSLGIHTLAVETWALAKEVAVAVASNTS